MIRDRPTGFEKDKGLVCFFNSAMRFKHSALNWLYGIAAHVTAA
jgi:hypothetical protein